MKSSPQDRLAIQLSSYLVFLPVLLTFALLLLLTACAGISSSSQPRATTVGVSVSPTSVALQSGQSKQFEATVTGTPNTAVTWTASIGTVSSSGLYAAPTVTSQSSDTVSAISVADSSKSASGSVTVTSATPELEVSLRPTSPA